MGSHLDAEALYRAHAEFVGRFLLRLGAEEKDVADLTQEVFLVAHRRGGFTPDRAKPTSWLGEIAFRVNSDRRKKKMRRREASDSTSVSLAPSNASSPREQVEAREALARVQSALNTLSRDKRVVFVLFELEGESCVSIAEALSIPVGTVYSRLHAARHEFAAAHAEGAEQGAGVGPSAEARVEARA